MPPQRKIRSDRPAGVDGESQRSPRPGRGKQAPSDRARRAAPEPSPPDPAPPEASPAAPATIPRHAPDLIPARMLNEFTYCPRLGYLEWAQGEFADNLDTLQGTFIHRNVDQQPQRRRKEPPPPVLHARSVHLSAESEGLTAKLDLLELDGPRATPIDYKRSAAPDLPEGAWEPERVQLCAQGLILRENGYACDAGELYFAGSRRRVKILFDEALIERTRQLAAEFRRVATAGQIPPPLVDSPKCPRCSLVTICLPDETNLLRSRDEAEDELPEVSPQPRRLIPSHEHARPLYLQEPGLTLGKSGEELVVRNKQETLQKLRFLDVSQVCLFGGTHITEPALRELVRRGVSICHFSFGGWFQAITTGFVHKNVELRIKQYAVAADPEAALVHARAMIVGKIKNSRVLLRRHLQSADRRRLLARLNEFAGDASRAKTREELLGIEGNSARLYFGGFAQLLKPETEFSIEGRNRRPPRDPVNALLSFLYALLTKEVTIAVQSVGFDPMLGLMHQPRYGRPSLALDLAEEFRPLIADSTVLTLINNGEIARDAFISRAGSVALTQAGRKSVMAAYERRLETEVTHPIFGYQLNYRRMLEVQARLLSRALLGEIPAYPPLATR